MPFIGSKITVKVSKEKKEIIKKRLGEAIELVPGKSERFLMVGFEDEYSLFFSGEELEKGAFVEVKIFGKTSKEAYDKLTKAICSIGLLVVGPLMHSLELFIFGAIRSFMGLPFGIGGLIIGGVHQIIVVTGIHHALNALEVELIASTGTNPFNAIITCAIAAQGAASVAVALKTKDKKKRSLYISSAVPAFLGITEPAIFGINLRFIKPFVFGCIGGAAGGMVSAMLHLAGTGMGITVLPGALLYIGNLGQYVLVNAISMGVAFCLTYFFFQTEE